MTFLLSTIKPSQTASPSGGHMKLSVSIPLIGCTVALAGWSPCLLPKLRWCSNQHQRRAGVAQAFRRCARWRVAGDKPVHERVCALPRRSGFPWLLRLRCRSSSMALDPGWFNPLGRPSASGIGPHRLRLSLQGKSQHPCVVFPSQENRTTSPQGMSVSSRHGAARGSQGRCC